MAMYSAKEEGKNQYRYFTPAMQEAAASRMRIVSDMRGALDASQIELVYQPIVNLSTGRIQKAEALIRWQHPEKGLIGPIDFISVAEDSGMISPFGNWVFREASRQAAVWRENHHPDFQISVNISPAQFRNGGLDPTAWIRHLNDISLPGPGIVVEITEGLLLDADSTVCDNLLALKNSGMEISLDDFGTGYSSLARLKQLDIDFIKIDRELVRNITSAPGDLTLCEAIIVMAHKLDIRVIAKGIETRDQHELLAKAACDFGQGYFFSKPVSAAELERLLKDAPFFPRELLDI